MSDEERTRVTLSAAEHEGAATWALWTTGNARQRGHATNIGDGLYQALETLLTDPDLIARPIDLYIDSDEHRPLFADLINSLPNITLHDDRGGSSTAARRYAIGLLPRTEEHPVRITETARLRIGTDGSVGPGGGGKPIISGAAWIDERGAFGYDVFPNLKQPLDAELQAVRLALEAHPHQRVRLLCDSRDAIRTVRHLNRGGSIGDLNLTARRHGYVTRLKQAMTDPSGVSIRWVKGHDSTPLNLGADRLAVLARRSYQMGRPEQVTRDIALRIVDETMTLLDQADQIASEQATPEPQVQATAPDETQPDIAPSDTDGPSLTSADNDGEPHAPTTGHLVNPDAAATPADISN